MILYVVYEDVFQSICTIKFHYLYYPDPAMLRQVCRRTDPIQLVTYNQTRHSYHPYKYLSLTVKPGADSGLIREGYDTDNTSSSSPLSLDGGATSGYEAEPLVSADQYVELVQQEDDEHETFKETTINKKGTIMYIFIKFINLLTFIWNQIFRYLDTSRLELEYYIPDVQSFADP